VIKLGERAKIFEIVLIGIMVAAVAAIVVFADPLGPDNMGTGPSQRRGLSTSPKSAPAEAGNVTELKMNGTTITKTWQGYFGNVSGRISLADGNNNSLYDWLDANPKGQIYASNGSSVSWANVFCYNMDPSAPGNTGNLTTFESYLGVPAAEYDGINETFNTKAHSSFVIGARTIVQNSCWVVKTYVNGAPQTSTTDFIELAMYDNVTNIAVFATLLNNTVTGFNERKWDFQMIVPVKGGHDTPPTGEPFYFYIELI
jgi:hypothetical protein